MTAGSRRQQSLNDRIRVAAASLGVDANRIRRALVYQRVLSRLAGSDVVLKGGFCLEVRLPQSARATNDIDLVTAVASHDDADAVADFLDEHLSEPGEDGYSFEVGDPVRLRDQDAEAGAWRVPILCRFGGSRFETIKVDVVGQLAEVAGATELLTIQPPVTMPGVDAFQVRAVDVFQHAAEKYHAYARIYSQDRPSSRVKDLVDLVLLIEAGLLTDPPRLGQRLTIVHRIRDGENPPASLEPPPGDWRLPYRGMAAELGLDAATTESAYELILNSYTTALEEGTD